MGGELNWIQKIPPSTSAYYCFCWPIKAYFDCGSKLGDITAS